MGGMAILFWQKENRLLEEGYLNIAMRMSYLGAVQKAGGFADWDKALVWKCLNCVGARLKANGFFEGNRKAQEWLTRNQDSHEAPNHPLGDSPQRAAFHVARRFQKLENKGFMWVIFKDGAVSCLHQAKCIYHAGICLSCGKESTPYISLGIERQGWAPVLKDHVCYCIECYQEKMKMDKVSFLSSLRFQRQRQELKLLSGGRGR